ncbi:MAG: T9SS type A sorting domain-containing protein [Ignavibacteriaceae bacterium]
MKYVYSVLTVLIFFFFISRISLAQNLWEPSGIDGGRTNTIVKVTDNVFLAGYVGGGLFRSTDGGENWYSISNEIDNIGVFVLKISAAGDVYAGTLQSIYKSTDQGVTWNKVDASLPQNGYAEDITFDNSDNIYVTNAYEGVYKSTDAGNSWTLFSNGLPSSKYVRRIEFTSNNILLLSDLYRGIYKSTDFGANWIQSNTGLDSTYYVSSFGSNSAGEIFISTSGNGPFKSTDNGNSWVSIQGDLSLPYASDIDFTSTGDLYLTIVQQLYKSTNGGTNWSNITTMFNGFGFQSAYVDNNDNVWATTLTSGIIKSSDAGANWINYTSGLTSTLNNSFFSDASGNLYAAIQGKGFYSSTDNGNTWNKITIVNNEEDTFIKTAELIPSGGVIVFNAYNGIKVSTDLITWNSFSTGLTNQNIQELAVSDSAFFAASSDGKIYGTYRSAANWVEITDPSVSGYPYDLFVSSTGALYYLFDEEIYKSTNDGDEWINIGNGVDGYSFSITEHSNGNVFVGTSDGVYRSTDAGDSWTKDVSGLTDGGLSLAIHSNGSIFAGGYSSTSRSNDLGQTWIPFTSGMFNCRITDLAFGSGDILFASAENMGVYRTTSSVTSVDENESGVVNNFSLEQNYPNPFNPSTNIQYAISNKQFVQLKVYDMLGNEIATLVNEEKTAGNYEINFNASKFSSGVYFYKLNAGSLIETKKMILIK